MSSTVTPLLPGAIGIGTETGDEDWGEPDWQDFALCAQVDPDLFFPGNGDSVRDPKKVCRNCEVRSECLDYAFEHDVRHGIWGGTSEQERRRMRREVA